MVWPANQSMDKNFMNQYGKVPPQARDIEVIVLGQMLMDTDCIGRAVELLTPESFYVDAHREIFEAIMEMKSGVDILTLSEFMKKKGNLEKVGGRYFISDLPTQVGMTTHFDHHCMILIEQEIKRRMIVMGSDVISEGYDDGDVFELLEKNSVGLEDIYARINRLKRKSLDDVWDLPEAERMITTGYADLDKACSINAGNLILIAARPGVGKTWLMLNLAVRQICAIFSLEMSIQEIASRIKKLIDQRPDKVYVVDNLVRLDAIIAEMRIQRNKGTKLFFLDYLQLVSGEGDYREQEVASIARRLKQFATETGSVVFANCQLNRAIEKRSDKEPVLSDLRESGELEQAADMVWMLSRPEANGLSHIIIGDRERVDLKDLLVVTVVKNRHGIQGLKIALRGQTRFFDDGIDYLPQPDKLPF